MEQKLTNEEQEELIKLTKELIKIPSSIHDGSKIYDYVRDYLRNDGLKPKFQSIKNPYLEYTDFSNLYLKVGNCKGPKIMLNGHLDTVVPGKDWFHSPYSGYETKSKIFGIGAADMKGGCAAALIAFKAFISRKKNEDINGELFCSFVFGEEAPFSLGADTLLREYDLKDYDLVIVTEPSPLLAINDYCYTHKRTHKSKFPVVIIGAEGRVLFEVEFFGKSTHASHPSQGINALHSAAILISKLDDFDVYSSIKMGRGHYCVLGIEGGDEIFTVPSYCKIRVNRQLTLGETEKSTISELKKIIRNLKLKSKVTIKKRFSPSPELEYRPYLFEKSRFINSFIRTLPQPTKGKHCRFTSSSIGDFNLFATRTKVPTLVFGPGGGNIHSADEYVNKTEIIDTANYLLNYFMEIF
jgi:succinyl-diaminopimelate desuccinylase